MFLCWRYSETFSQLITRDLYTENQGVWTATRLPAFGDTDRANTLTQTSGIADGRLVTYKQFWPSADGLTLAGGVIEVRSPPSYTVEQTIPIEPCINFVPPKVIGDQIVDACADADGLSARRAGLVKIYSMDGQSISAQRGVDLVPQILRPPRPSIGMIDGFEAVP